MVKESHPGYKCHVFVCVNNRTDERKACAHNKSSEIRQKLKIESRKRWPKETVRVSQSGCLGVCEQGPNVMIYPQNKWFTKVSIADVDQILNEIGKLVDTEK